MSETKVASENVSVFETQVEGEKLLALYRAHFVTNTRWILITILLAATPPIVAIINVLDPIISNFNIPSYSVDGFALIWYLGTFAFAFQHFLNWYFNIYIVTDRRIVDMDFFQLLYKKVSSAHLENIEDITFTIGGVSQVLFHYGDIHIQTAGTENNFEFLKVPNPNVVKQIIEEAKHKATQR
jgi:hypothetical protein